MRPVLHADCSRAPLRRLVKVPCQVVRERDYKLVGSHVLDLSAKGMLLECDVPLLTGEELLVGFTGPSSRRVYECRATVARVIHGRRRADRRRALGISLDMNVLDELLLCEELRHAAVTSRHLVPRVAGAPAR